jgi:GT2 family glycosyltransferase
MRRRDLTFSVVICTLDRCESLRRALDGLAQQTFRRFEVVVVNGPSSDGTSALLEGYPVKVASYPGAAHVSRARNVGVQLAAGDVFAFLDDDAAPAPDWLELLAGTHEDTAVAAAGGPVFDVPLDRVEWAICTSTRDGAVDTDSEPPADGYLGRGADPFLYFAGCNMSVRRSAFRDVGGFNPVLPYCYEDTELCMRLVDADARLVWVEEALVRHERAASALRDGEQVITDPYALTHSFAAFVQQASPATAPRVVAQWREAWTSGPADLVPVERRAWFRDRVEQGLADGVLAGRQPRQKVRLDRGRRRDLRPYV